MTQPAFLLSTPNPSAQQLVTLDGTIQSNPLSAGAAGGLPAPGTPAYNPPWYALTDIFWDSQAGNDGNSGASGSPVATWAEVMRRYGAISVLFLQGASVKVHMLSAQNANVDPVFGEFLLTGGAQVVVDCTAAWVPAGADFAAGALAGGYGFAGATPTAGGSPMTMAAVPAYVVKGTLLQNTTRGSFAFVRSVAAGTATLTQPQTSASLLTTTAIPAGVVDNDWVAGDNIHPVTLPNLNYKKLTGVGGDLTAAGQPSSLWLIGASTPDTSTNLTSEIPIENKAAIAVLSLCLIGSRLHAGALSGRGEMVYLLGCMVLGAFANFGAQTHFFGGSLEAGSNSVISGVPVLDNNCNVHLSFNVTGGEGSVVIGAGGVWADGNFSIRGSLMQITGTFWGSYSILAIAGATILNTIGAGFWTSRALLTSGLQKFGTGAGAITVGTPASVGGTFVLNGATQVNVAPGGGQHFPANAKILLSLNTVGGTPGTTAPFFSAAQTADQFSIKSGTAGANDTYNWQARDGSVTISPVNLDLFNAIYDEASGARYCLNQ